MSTTLKKLLYIANIRLPTEKAHGLQIMKTCEALAGQNIQVELVVPQRATHIQRDVWSFYDVAKDCFSIKYLPAWDALALPFLKKLGFWATMWSFYREIKKYLLVDEQTVLYTRDVYLADRLSKKYPRVFYELHTIPERITSRHRRAWAQCQGLVVISNGIAQELIRQGIEAKKICTAWDAVDMTSFQLSASKEECRAQLGLDLHKKIVVYTGHLYEWKGANLLAQAAGQLKDEIEVYIVGGTPEDLVRFKRSFQASNLHIIGWQDHALIPYWNKAADAVILPTSGKQKIGALYTSPMKLFEYIASGTPIVAARLPSIQEVLFDRQAFFFDPDNVADLARVIRGALTQQSESKLKGIIDFTWKARARVLTDFFFRARNSSLPRFDTVG